MKNDKQEKCLKMPEKNKQKETLKLIISTVLPLTAMHVFGKRYIIQKFCNYNTTTTTTTTTNNNNDNSTKQHISIP